MPVNSLKRPSSYSHCPLKKRPLKYDPLEDCNSDSDLSSKGSSPLPVNLPEPENLSTKPEDLRMTGNLKEKSLPSPPPISLVAGRGEGHPLSSAHQQCRNVESYSRDTKPIAHYGNHIKSNGTGPLASINLNAPASWSKVQHHPYVPLNFPVSSRSAFEMFSPSAPHSRSAQNVNQFASHFTPLNGYREPGSPPHVSPPLSLEPAYPVLRIEENHRPRVQQTSQLGYNNEDMKRESYSHATHHHYNVTKQESCHSHPSEYKQESAAYYSYHLSPSHSPSHHDCNSRDSISSHEADKRSSPDQASPIVPINVNGSIRYQCPNCSKSYSTYSGLTKHMQFHCASQNKKSFICKFCEKVYVSLGALKMHIRTHTLPCKCTICGKAFSRPWLLQGHIRTHTGEKPFTCQHCHRAFADRSNLRAHLQTHSEVKKYSCKCCSKTFSRMSLLVKHEEGGCSSSSIMTNSD